VKKGLRAMSQLSITSFFSLEGYAHARLFENCSFAWEPLNYIEAYLQSLSLGKIEADVSKSAFLVHPHLISIGRGTKVEPGAYIEGPCVIGENCTIRHGAYLRGNVVVGNNCVIGHDTEVKHSILLNNVCAAHFNYVGDSILGSHVNLGAGSKCANFRLDEKPVVIAFAERVFPTNRRKLGAILGDGVQVGCNCVLNPGTMIGKNSVCYPCINVSGYIASNAKVKPAQKYVVEE
jgi:NDP-sugar pyrophosphorylase family protein